MRNDAPFYDTTPLAQMSAEEWESLCDGCGQCCTVLLQDEVSGTLWRTDAACRLLDLETVRCSDYANRHARVPGCVKLTAKNLSALSWMPDTCAYRLLNEGRPLPDWHPLRTGERESVVRAGVSVRGTLVSETEIDPDELEDRIVAPR